MIKISTIEIFEIKLLLRKMYLNFGSYRYRGSDICTILLLIPKSTPNTFRASGFGSTYHTYYTWIFARRYARAADSVVEVC